jgi:hypothetical protein
VASELQLSKVGRVAEFMKIWTNLAFRYKSGFWQILSMTFPETLYMKNAVNKLNFPLVTHMACFETRFGRYGLLKSGYNAELFWTAWTLE